MRQRRTFQSEAVREKVRQRWEEEIRQKAIRVIKAYGVTPEADRIWREARTLFRFSLGQNSGGLLLYSLLLPSRNGKVIIAISRSSALVRLRPCLGRMTEDLRLLLGDQLQVEIASFDRLLWESHR